MIFFPDLDNEIIQGMSEYSYLLIKLEVDDSTELDTSIQYLETNITFALKTLFGDCGAYIPFSVLKFSDLRAIISCPDTCLIKLRTALTLQKTYQGSLCCFTILKATKNLLTIRI